jgi:hypothetical protein
LSHPESTANAASGASSWSLFSSVVLRAGWPTDCSSAAPTARTRRFAPLTEIASVM